MLRKHYLRRSARISKLDRKTNEYIREKNGRARYDIGWHNPETTYLVWSCRENGPNTTTKNYDLLETWRKETTRPSPENLELWNIYSHEWKRSKNGRMGHSKAMEYESRKASSDVLKPQAAHLLRSWVQIPPGAWIFVCCKCRVLSGRGLCDELITRPEESYRLCCVVVCDLETSRMGAPYIYIWH